MGRGRRRKELVAVVELGSNAVRCLLARVKPGTGFRVLEEARVQTRLGEGPPGRLTPAAIDATLRAVRRFLRRARDRHDPRVVAVATSAVRDAANRERLLGPLRREGVPVRVLTPGEESRLGALAAQRSLSVRKGLIADLGGSSLQLSRVRAGRVISTTSLPLGAVRTTRRFLRHDPPKAAELRGLRRTVHAALVHALAPARRGEPVVGLGGTVRTLARMHLRANGIRRAARHGLTLRQSDVTAIRERIEPRGAKRRRRLPGLNAERVDVILAGAIVIEAVMTLGGYLTLVVCTRGVRDGLLLREAFGREAGT